MGRFAFKNIFIAGFIFLSILNGCTQTKYNKKDSSEISKEYKLLIKGDVFSDRTSGYNKICEIIENNLNDFKYPVKFTRIASNEKQKHIEYLDTKSKDFLKSNFVLRKTTKIKKNEERNELSLKYKTENSEITINHYDNSYNSDYNCDIKLEEDILICVSDSVFFKNILTETYTIKDVDIRKNLKISDCSTLYPILLKLKINPEMEVSLVNGIRINEYSIKIGKIYFDDNIKSNVELAVWYKENEQNPLLAEISYRVEVPKGSTKLQEVINVGNEFLKLLYRCMSEITITEKTKTDIIYNYN
jgi:hypothetical protein